MNISPDLKEIKKLASTGTYKAVPLSCEILSDFITPIETMRILKNISAHCYLLESAQADETWGRYTFLGFDPKLEITCTDGEIQAGSIHFHTEHPSEYLRQVLADYKSPRFEHLPPFTGGLVGYFSYDYLGYSEPAARCHVEDTESFRDMDLMLFDKVIAFDHVQQKIILIVNTCLDDPETGYNKAVLELRQLVSLLRTGEKKKEAAGKLLGAVTPLFDKDRFCSMVEKAQHHIREGDIFQAVLSNRLSAPFEGSLFQTYRILRTVNPSPYMFYFSGTDVEIAGASPETLVKLENGVLHTFPLAGTRPRGRTPVEDAALEAELLSDEKELAEHNMLVDLGRNDLGKISKFGSVQVEKLHSVEHYSHVMHIGSTIRGEIREDKDALDSIEAILPAGTLSGAPKIRACQLIGDIKPDIRVIRNDEMSAEEIRRLNPERIILSPGPGRPEDAGVIMEAAKTLGKSIPILGVCLGHQAICAAFEASITYARELMHGKQSLITLDTDCPIFHNCPKLVSAARYHSLAVDPETIPECLKVTAVTQEGEIMAVQHWKYPVYGVQFHPESILTPDGKTMLENFIKER